MKILIKIGSISSAITNSSSETFLIKSERPSNEVRKIIKSYADSVSYYEDKDLIKIKSDLHNKLNKYSLDYIDVEDTEHYSGMGGELSIEDYQSGYEYYIKNYKKNKKEKVNSLSEYAALSGIDENELSKYVIIDIDNAMKATLKFIYENFDVLLSYDSDEVTDYELKIYNAINGYKWS